MSDRPEYLLYCMAQSGNAYRVALMLNLIGADWKPVFVDFFVARRDAHREVPHRDQRNGRSAGARSRRPQIQPVGGVPHLPRQALRQVSPRGRRRRARMPALAHFRQPEGQRLSRPLSVSQELRPGAVACRRSVPAHRLGISLPIIDKRLAKSPYLLGPRRPSPTSRSRATSTIRRRNSASTSPRTILTSAPGWTASRRCRDGSIPMS